MGTTEYFHSVRLIEDECKGCTHCIRTCPTEAIRVRNGKATIMSSHCIDCGECIRGCPNHAKFAVTEKIDVIKAHKYKIAIPAPSIMGQFSRKYPVDQMLSGFLYLGFDDVLEVAVGAQLAAEGITRFLRERAAEFPRPAISSACPAVVRLIQVKYPGLVRNVLPILSPMEITARIAKERASKRLGIPMEDIGVYFISPCPAKVAEALQPNGLEKSYVDGVIAMRDMVDHIKKNFDKVVARTDIQRAGRTGIVWGRRGGEALTVDIPRKLAVDGIHDVSMILERIEDGGFQNINFIEAQACVGGCVGGALQSENPFVAKLKVEIVSNELADAADSELEEIRADSAKEYYLTPKALKPRPATPLSADVNEAMRRLKEIEKLHEELPGIDCGSCGCPTCRAFAEDVTAGLIMRMDCLFDLRERVLNLAQEIFALAGKLPHVMREKKEEPL